MYLRLGVRGVRFAGSQGSLDGPFSLIVHTRAFRALTGLCRKSKDPGIYVYYVGVSENRGP